MLRRKSKLERDIKDASDGCRRHEKVGVDNHFCKSVLIPILLQRLWTD